MDADDSAVTDVRQGLEPDASGKSEEAGVTLRYWPWWKKPPDGWEIVDDMANCHHGEHAVILREIERPRDAKG
jgi:hypothetical protein